MQDGVNVELVRAQAEAELLRAELSSAKVELAGAKKELAKWKDYTGCDFALEAFQKIDPYSEYYSALYHRVRGLCGAYRDAQGRTCGWGDFGSPMPTLIRLLEASGCTLADQHKPYVDSQRDGTVDRDRVLALWAELHRTLSLMESEPAMAKGNEFYQAFLRASEPKDSP